MLYTISIRLFPLFVYQLYSKFLWQQGERYVYSVEAITDYRLLLLYLRYTNGTCHDPVKTSLLFIIGISVFFASRCNNVPSVWSNSDKIKQTEL